MSRVAKQPVLIPSGIEITIDSGVISIKGQKAKLAEKIHQDVTVTTAELSEEGKSKKIIQVNYDPAKINANAQAGTLRAKIQNMVKGVSQGFEKTLELVGVGYRAKVEGKIIQLTLGFSHPVSYALPDGITAEVPSPTQIVLKGADRQKVGQAASEIRELRPPEPYKGKGVKYGNEVIAIKETKKK